MSSQDKADRRQSRRLSRWSHVVSIPAQQKHIFTISKVIKDAFEKPLRSSQSGLQTNSTSHPVIRKIDLELWPVEREMIVLKTMIIVF